MTDYLTLPPPAETRWVILGRHHAQDPFIEQILDLGCPKPLVLTYPDESYSRDRRLLRSHGLFGRLDEFMERGLVEVHAFENFNDPVCLDFISDRGCNAGFSIGSRDILKPPLIEHFEGRILNIHDSMLPNERGAALNTWRILNDIRSVGNTIHVIDPGIDTGPVVLQQEAALDQKYPKPIDYDHAQAGNVRELFAKFAEIYNAEGTFPLTPQNKASGFYFPALHTELNGAVDLEWPVDVIERFIRAFDTPYPGAFSFLKDTKVHLHDAEIVAETGFHPFGNGKIVRVPEDGSVHVIAGCGLLRVPEITIDGERMRADARLKLRQTLMTPAAVLATAKTTVPALKKIR